MQKRLDILPIVLLIFISYACHSAVVLFLVLLFPVYLLPLQLLAPRVHRHAYPLRFLFFLLILSDVDSMHFVAFILLHVKRLQLKCYLR